MVMWPWYHQNLEHLTHMLGRCGGGDALPLDAAFGEGQHVSQRGGCSCGRKRRDDDYDIRWKHPWHNEDEVIKWSDELKMSFIQRHTSHSTTSQWSISILHEVGQIRGSIFPGLNILAKHGMYVDVNFFIIYLLYLYYWLVIFIILFIIFV